MDEKGSSLKCTLLLADGNPVLFFHDDQGSKVVLEEIRQFLKATYIEAMDTQRFTSATKFEADQVKILVAQDTGKYALIPVEEHSSVALQQIGAGEILDLIRGKPFE